MKYLLAVLLCINTAFAATFTTEPVKIIVPLPAGSGPDAKARQLAELLTARWHRPVIIENKPGGNGAIAMDVFVQEAHTGPTLYLATSENIVSFPILYGTNTFHKIIEPVAPFFKNDLMLFTSPKNATYQDLKLQISKKPIFGTQAIGSSSHLAGLELAQNITNLPTTVVPYKDYSQWFVDVSNQEVTYGFGTVASSKGLEQLGKIKYLATTGATRNPDYPQVPTIKEVADINVTNVGWLAFYASKNMSDSDRALLVHDLNETIQSTEMRNRITSVSYQPFTGSLSDFKRQVDADSKRFQILIKKYDIKVN